MHDLGFMMVDQSHALRWITPRKLPYGCMGGALVGNLSNLVLIALFGGHIQKSLKVSVTPRSIKFERLLAQVVVSNSVDLYNRTGSSVIELLYLTSF